MQGPILRVHNMVKNKPLYMILQSKPYPRLWMCNDNDGKPGEYKKDIMLHEGLTVKLKQPTQFEITCPYSLKKMYFIDKTRAQEWQQEIGKIIVQI